MLPWQYCHFYVSQLSSKDSLSKEQPFLHFLPVSTVLYHFLYGRHWQTIILLDKKFFWCLISFSKLSFQFVSVRSYLIAATTLYSGFFQLSLVTRFACDIGQLARIWIWVTSEVITILVSTMDISRTADYFIACYTVLMRLSKVETAVHCCKCWLSVWTL